MSRKIFFLDTGHVETELLRSEDVHKVLREYAEKVLARCGTKHNYRIGHHETEYRSVYRIETADKNAYYSNLHHNTLIKALWGEADD